MILGKIFGKKPAVSVDVIDFNAKHVATGQVGAYIKKLYREENFLHIGYRFENKKGNCRFVIYTLPGQREVIQYFKDRCPVMVEKECMELTGEAHEFSIWANGFEEVKSE